MAQLSAGTAFVTILADMSKFAATVNAGLTKNQASLLKTGKAMTKYLTLPILAAGAASVKFATDFEAQLSEIQGLAGASAKQTEAWGKQLLKLGPAVAKGPQELAKAMYFVASSGVDASKAMDVVTISAKASAAGLGDTEVVADAVTSAMNAYANSNLTAAQAADVLTATVREGKGEASAIAPVLGSLLPLASELSVKFSDVGAAIAAMTTTGDSASIASTKLNAIFSALIKTTPAADKAFKKAGLSVDELRDSLGQKGLLPTLETVRAAVGDNIEALGAMFPNVRALRGVLSLTGANAEQVAEIFDKLHDSTGSTQEAFEEFAQTAEFRFKSALSKLQVAAIQFGSLLLPVVTAVVDAFGELFGWVTDLPEPMQKLIILIASVAAAVGPFLIVLSKIPVLVANIKKGFEVLTSFMSNPWVLALTAAALAAYTIVKAINAGKEASKEFHEQLGRLSEGFISFVQTANSVTAVATELGHVLLKALLEPIRQLDPEAYTKYYKMIIAGAEDGAKGVKDAQDTVNQAIITDNKRFWKTFIDQNEGGADRVREALITTNQKIASSLRQGDISIQEATRGWQAYNVVASQAGFAQIDLRERILGVVGAMGTFNVDDLITAFRSAGLETGAWDHQLDELISNQALMGQLTKTEFIDALLKTGAPLDYAQDKARDFGSALKQTTNNLDVTGKKIHVFTFNSAKDFQAWADDTSGAFEDFIYSNTKFKEAFNLTTKKFKSNMETWREIAKQGAKDINELTSIKNIDPEFENWLITQGPAAIHAFVEGNASDRDDMQKIWKDISGFVDDHAKKINELDGTTAEVSITGDASQMKKEVENTIDYLRGKGFTLTPEGSMTFGKQQLHEGGMPGQNAVMHAGRMGPDEVAAVLQKGEFVVRRDVVGQPGVLDMLTALNSGDKPGEYHVGGVVEQTSSPTDKKNKSAAEAIDELRRTFLGAPDISGEFGAEVPSGPKVLQQFMEQFAGASAEGLSPRAARYMATIGGMFPQVQGFGTISRRNIAGTNSWSQHAFGNAIDVMTGSDSALRSAVAVFSNANKTMLSIAHLLADPWFPSPRGDHYNHVHADFNPQGTGTPPPGGGWIGAAEGFAGYLAKDTKFQAHAGEYVSIAPVKDAADLVVDAFTHVYGAMTDALDKGFTTTNTTATQDLGVTIREYKTLLNHLAADATKTMDTLADILSDDKGKLKQAIKKGVGEAAARATLELDRELRDRGSELQHRLNEAASAFDKLISKFRDFKSAIHDSISSFNDFGSVLSGAWSDYQSQLEDYQNSMADFVASGQAAALVPPIQPIQESFSTLQDYLAAMQQYRVEMEAFQQAATSGTTAPTAPTAPNFGDLIRQQVEDAQRLAKDLSDAAAAGLSKDLLQQFASQGIAGANALEELLKNPELIQQLNDAAAEINKAAGTTSDALGDKFFGKAIRVASNHLEHLGNALEKLVDRINNLKPNVNLNVSVSAPAGTSAPTSGTGGHQQQGGGGHGSKPGGGGGGGNNGGGGGGHTFPTNTATAARSAAVNSTLASRNLDRTAPAVNVTVNGWVGSDQKLATKLRDELLRVQRNNGGTGL